MFIKLILTYRLWSWGVLVNMRPEKTVAKTRQEAAFQIEGWERKWHRAIKITDTAQNYGA